MADLIPSSSSDFNFFPAILANSGKRYIANSLDNSLSSGDHQARRATCIIRKSGRSLKFITNMPPRLPARSLTALPFSNGAVASSSTLPPASNRSPKQHVRNLHTVTRRPCARSQSQNPRREAPTKVGTMYKRGESILTEGC